MTISGKQTEGSVHVTWIDDTILEVRNEGRVTGAVVARALDEVRRQTDKRQRPWAMLFNGEGITHIAPDARTGGTELLRVVRERNVRAVAGMSENMAGRMLAAAVSLAVGLPFKIFESREAALEFLRQSCK